jgi:hypothetical protein
LGIDLKPEIQMKNRRRMKWSSAADSEQAIDGGV